MILDDVAMRLRPLLPSRDFIRFCEKRNLLVSRELLYRLEELRAFTPIIRIMGPDDEDRVLYFDGTSTAPDFEAGWIADTSAPGATYSLPDIDDSASMAFYSEFQVWALEQVLRETTRTFRLDEYAGADVDAVDWNDRFRWLRSQASDSVARLRSDPLLAAIPILCQVIANRYLPYALGNERTIRVGGTTHFGSWMQFSSLSWDWRSYCESWDPANLVSPFAIDEASLERAHVAMVIALRNCDPLWAWGELTRFINQRKRDQLQGDALRAELYRQSAEMLRRLHQELYGADLGPPEDMFGVVMSHIPELDVRDDPREYLKFVVNQYDLNPQPKAVLLVGGETEVVFVKAMFRRLFGAHHGVSGLEIVNLRGVDNATGNKTSDRFSAIFRLVDYLHEHQTLAFIMLDNEGQARNLRESASHKASVFEIRKRAIPPDRIHVWNQNFELDNFEDAEIARALTETANNSVRFRPSDIETVRSEWPAGGISTLFQTRTGRGLSKPVLAEHLAEIAIASETRQSPSDRPIVDFLERVSREASMNPLPITEEIWRENQEYLDEEVTKRQPDSSDHGSPARNET